MSSKRRIRRKACKGKYPHATQSDAVAHLISLHHKDSRVMGVIAPMAAYKCKFCKQWHVGHK